MDTIQSKKGAHIVNQYYLMEKLSRPSQPPLVLHIKREKSHGTPRKSFNCTRHILPWLICFALFSVKLIHIPLSVIRKPIIRIGANQPRFITKPFTDVNIRLYFDIVISLHTLSTFFLFSDIHYAVLKMNIFFPSLSPSDTFLDNLIERQTTIREI